MDRRSFIKAVGISGLIPISSIFARKEPINPYLSAEYIKSLEEGMKNGWRGIDRANGPDKCFFVIVHPKQTEALKNMLAKEKFKQEQHIRRWEKRYGKEYQKADGEIFMSENVQWIESRRIAI